MSTSAMPLMPMPPIPTKWIAPMSRGSFIGLPLPGPRSPRAGIGGPLGRVGGALRAGGGGHGYEFLRRAGKRGDLRRQPIGREVLLLEPHRPARRGQHAGIGGLVLI